MAYDEGACKTERSPDCMTGIISQTNEHLQEVEKRLTTIISRLSPTVEKNTDKRATLEAMGLVNAAQGTRANASRLLDLCARLDGLL